MSLLTASVCPVAQLLLQQAPDSRIDERGSCVARLGDVDGDGELVVFERERVERFLRVMRDDPRWLLDEGGERMAFEAPADFARRRVRDRFPLDRLIDHLHALGWPVREPGTWGSERPARRLRWGWRTAADS